MLLTQRRRAMAWPFGALKCDRTPIDGPLQGDMEDEHERPRLA